MGRYVSGELFPRLQTTRRRETVDTQEFTAGGQTHQPRRQTARQRWPLPSLPRRRRGCPATPRRRPRTHPANLYRPGKRTEKNIQEIKRLKTPTLYLCVEQGLKKKKNVCNDDAQINGQSSPVGASPSARMPCSDMPSTPSEDIAAPAAPWPSGAPAPKSPVEGKLGVSNEPAEASSDGAASPTAVVSNQRPRAGGRGGRGIDSQSKMYRDLYSAPQLAGYV